VGENKVKGKVINSTEYEKRLVEMLSEAKENITVKIKYDKQVINATNSVF
jgi:hypothetical protein